MIRKEGETWLRDAVKHIRFPPDRKRVREELNEHMVSRRQDFLAEGFSEEEADRRACEAMGDPEEVGKALAAVHKPFWGYVLCALRILLVLYILCAAVYVIRGGGGEVFNYPYLRVLNGEIGERVPEWISQSATDAMGDYRFRLVEAGITRPEPAEDARYFAERGTYLVLQLRSFTWDPNLGPPQFGNGKLTVEDSGGKVYPAFARGELDLIFAGRVTILVKDFDPASAWAVLSYEAGDRVLRLPVRLKGGSA